MAKRKRLTPAKTEFLSQTQTLETKSGVLSPAPIATVAAEASATAALSELSHMLKDARSEGRLIQSLDLEEIDPAYLVRDRISVDNDELSALMASIRQRGQQTAIEVVDHGELAAPRYGLISGWRRLAALKRISDDDDVSIKIQALIRSPETSSDAYVAMVEENEIRAGLSFYERARIVVKAMENGVYDDVKTALQSLYQNIPRAKRSKIKSFIVLVETLDAHLKFPSHIGERLGLAVSRFCSDHGPDRLISALQGGTAQNAEEEQDILRGAMIQPKAVSHTEQAVPQAKYSAAQEKIVISGADQAMFDAIKVWLSERG